jgi:hypothetical protein
MEVKINREIRDYTESMFFGLSLRQLVPSVLPQIIRETGFDSTDKFLSEMAARKRNILNNYVAQLETIIITAFPQYTFEQMRDWNIEQIC